MGSSCDALTEPHHTPTTRQHAGKGLIKASLAFLFMMLYVVIFYPSKLVALVLPVVSPIVGRGAAVVGRGAEAVRQRLETSSGTSSAVRSPARHHELRQRFENNV